MGTPFRCVPLKVTAGGGRERGEAKAFTVVMACEYLHREHLKAISGAVHVTDRADVQPIGHRPSLHS